MKIYFLLLSLLFLKCNTDISKDFKLKILEKSKNDDIPPDFFGLKNYASKSTKIRSMLIEFEVKYIKKKYNEKLF